jgi:NAD(P)-dependent dehydrogenase (short-subunit alcohol dehydrogenase family)
VIDLDRPFNFTGKTAVVIGGSGVLCGALAQALGRQGAAVVVVGHSHIEQAQQVAETITSQGGQATAVTADVLDRRSLEDLAGRTVETFGGVDVLVNGAGGAKPEATTSEDLSFFDLPEEAVRWVFDLNFMGTFLACQVFGRHMVGQDGGAVLNLASAGADRPLTRSVAYSAAKAAVVNFTKWLAVHVSQEYSPHIRVNALMPGFFLTEQNRFLLLDERSGELTERGRRIIAHTPMGRFGQPDDLIGPALLLLSEAAGFMHGTTLTVDGGISVYGGV